MREYLLKNFPTPYTLFWIGLIHAPDSTWQWLGGGTIATTHPSPFWGKSDPNDPEPNCGGMYLEPGNSYWYHLADAPCAKAYMFLCKQT
ncbi:C-type lectin domain family 4 member K-like [Hyalella azteca]|uniref:C-type lectin domain family 4 member K-like n=1 Tax=Hyalella azteca TaxID=294128 RepID=A0A8B7PRI0_HYAAZ|nr:C-type lectin domain family 4 member K-like [Hyalella azteca]